ncbi:MAG: hypothetical protein CMH28_00345 [Micavibrio sp.]|nr:hypothetical protein [Micavibrio sp.]
MQTITLPQLRQDLKIHEGGYDIDGSPTWMIYDPVTDNYYKIGWFEFECLQRFPRCATSAELVASLKKETTLDPSEEEIVELVNFLLMSRLLMGNNPGVQKFLAESKDKNKSSFIKRLTKNYVYFSFPLVRPEAFLKKTYPHVKFLFTKSFLGFSLFLLLVGCVITLQRMDEFLATFTGFFSIESVFMIAIATIFIKSVHELSHAYTAHKYNIPVSSIGVAFIVFYPILYTETTNAWKIYDRRKRIKVAAAGVTSEIVLASFALLFWNVLNPGFGQNLMFFIAFISLLASFFINMNPLMKFDGYYLFSDFIRIDNLQSRSIAYFKWWLRKTLLGWRVDTPEILGKKTEHFLIRFGTALVIYRFFLYLSISILIYFLFFKPLGAILMLVEIAWFIGVPVWKELNVWYSKREYMYGKKHIKIFIVIFAVLLLAVFLPLKNTINIPAVLHAGQYADLYSPLPAKVVDISIENGEEVRKGQVLFLLSSSQLDNDIAAAKVQLSLLKRIKDREQAVSDLPNKSMDIDEHIDEAQIRLDGLLEQKSELEIRAPFDGYVHDLDPSLHEGRIVNSTTTLAHILQDNEHRVTGYIKEGDISRVELGFEGSFKPDSNFLGRTQVRLIEISQSSTKEIRYPELASVYGGSIPAEMKNERAVSHIPLYILNFEIEETDYSMNGSSSKGIVSLEGEPVSFIGIWAKKILSLFIREAGI